MPRRSKPTRSATPARRHVDQLVDLWRAVEDHDMTVRDADHAPSAVAMSVARAMGTELNAPREDRVHLEGAAFAVGIWLEERGDPNDLDTLDVAGLLEVTSFPDDVARDYFLFALSGLVGFAGLNGYMRPANARKGLATIAQATTDPILRRFAGETARGLIPLPRPKAAA